MKGLMVKELILMKKSCILLIFFMIVYGAMAVAGGEPHMLLVLPLFFSAMSIGIMNRDEMSKWNRYSVIMPLERKTIVNSRYLFALGMDAASIVIILIAYFMAIAMGKMEFSSETLTFLLIGSLLTGLVVPIIMIPIVLRFSMNAAIYAGLAVGALAGGITGILSGMEDSEGLAKIIKMISDFKNVMPYILLALLLLFLAISWAISLKVYKHKDI